MDILEIATTPCRPTRKDVYREGAYCPLGYRPNPARANCMGRLEDRLGADKPAHEITNEDIQRITTARRACMKASGRDDKGRRLFKPIANATVNQTLE